ncbi:NAD(P)H-dependent oxidoreductase [Adhaeribacter radiodurans]|uniref:NAD(P)H-dependent oxidoreductase n=1 Tax=Adhaeribacter radiodurans TaxID=2745197 RepID=A0A7L7L918_9BACT|nr:NAD(P)H-dependent oxidoreductase [Adhaeribacter radiodurans]QMU29320.1 NAD(P)H-dependent oxidoreductase [Adhaeribacter radiodurans]
MKPNDDNARLPVDQRPFRVLIISGSDRRQYNCPGVDSKSRALMLQMADMLPPEWEIDYEDLGNVYGRARIQSCNACVSTSMALCVWPCNCYEKNSSSEPDLLWDVDLYARLDMADAWAIIGPINWYGPTSNLKLMFDRLVCMNGGNPDENTIDHKDPEKAMELEHQEKWQSMSQNHLEGRTAAFFCYGDEGGDEMDKTGRPKILRHKQYFDPQAEPYAHERDAYAPLVWQCRYGGVEVPDNLWVHCTSGKGRKYSDNQAEDMIQEQEFMATFNQWVQEFTLFVAEKGKVPPNQYRAYGYERPNNLLKELKTGIRAWKLRFGLEPENSSNQVQKELGINDDTTLNPKKSEGEKLRNK